MVNILDKLHFKQHMVTFRQESTTYCVLWISILFRNIKLCVKCSIFEMLLACERIVAISYSERCL